MAVQWSLKVRENLCSRFRSSTIAHFNTNISTFRDTFQRFVMTARGWQVGFPNSSVIVQIILSFAQFCLPLSQVDFFCVSWYETLRQSFYTNSCTKKVFVFYYKQTSHSFYAFWRNFIFPVLVLH